MQREDAVALVRRLVEAGVRRDVQGLMELYAEDAVAISPVFGEVRGRANIVATWEKLFRTVADISLEVSDVLVDGDRIGILSTIRATDRAGWFGLPPTGGPISYRLVM